VPDFRAATLASWVPFGREPDAESYTPEGAVLASNESVYLPSVVIGPGFAETLGVRILEGRDFSGADRSDTEPVILVNAALARTYWPGQTDVSGRRVKSGSLDTEDEGWFRVIGVLSDMRNRLGAEPVPTIYHPLSQAPDGEMNVIVRHTARAEVAANALREALRQLDPTLPIRSISSVEDLAARSVVQPRFYTLLATGLGGIAMLLALVGIYGTAAYMTARRSREIGIRIALGASGVGVTRMFVAESMRLTLAGVACGFILAVAGARLLDSYLFGVTPLDAATFVFAGAMVSVTAFLAAWIPAARAVRVDAMSTLRSDG
jgi:predicted permease